MSRGSDIKIKLNPQPDLLNGIKPFTFSNVYL